ncbi:ATP-dependent protease La [Phycomyces nitens]|nr:ATP-dependent protease La [Phycomyces nitens]
MANLPADLTIIPLERKVLLPHVVLRVVLRGAEAAKIIKRHSIATRQGVKLHIACVPLKSLKKDPNVLKDRDSSGETDETCQASLAPISFVPPSNDPENNDENQTEDVDSLVPHGKRKRLYAFGCTGTIIRIQRLDADIFGVFIEGGKRFRVQEYNQDSDAIWVADVEYLEEPKSSYNEEMVVFKALCRSFATRMQTLCIPESLTKQLVNIINTVPVPALADMVVSMIETTFEERLMMLSTADPKERLEMASTWITRQLNVLQISKKIHSGIETNLTQKQREFYLRQQLDEVKSEIQGSQPVDDKEEDELERLNRRLIEARLPEEPLKVARRELKRIKQLHPTSTEWAVSRNYLEWVTDLPWSNTSESVLDIRRATHQLNQDHFGLEHVKKRIIEYLCVTKLKGDLKAPILCFVGPPGVGKTSLGKSIAISLSREFHRISLGGVHDEADMRGHRRTYVGAMPGLIIQGLRKCGVNNPLFLLDEIDKLGQTSNHGNPAAALLEILDPEQNNTFSDHYLNMPFDLSNVLVIATANSLDTIPEPLVDRMEIIQLHGYTFDEKLHIAKAHLLPKQTREHGMDPGQITISDAVLFKLAENYTRESGVRQLERKIATLVRAKCVDLVHLKESGKEQHYRSHIQLDDLETLLGPPMFEKEVAERDSQPGIATGLAYSGSGQGGILFIEATKMPGTGKLQLTGSLGEVIKESANIALSWVKAHAEVLKLGSGKNINIMNQCDVHIHVPNGSVPKDGPSAGITLVSALVSLFSRHTIPTTTAMTGEISLRGQVLPVGGIKEKVISAHRAGITKIILPYRNKRDVTNDIPDKVQNEIEIVYAKTIWDVLRAALVSGSTPDAWLAPVNESVL